jgi:5-methylcytosine-specific restriction endonuclease McrA
LSIRKVRGWRQSNSTMPKRPQFHQPRYKPPTLDQVRGTAASRGYGSDWRRFREYVLRDEPLCVFRDDPRHRHECTHAATVLDHVKPLSQGGARLCRENTRGVCAIAHQRLTQNLKDTGRNELPALNLPIGVWA